MPVTLFAHPDLLFGPVPPNTATVNNSKLNPLALLATRTAADYSPVHSSSGFTITRNGYTFAFTGEGLTYDGSNVPDGGVVEGLSIIKGGVEIYEFLATLDGGLGYSIARFNVVFSTTDVGKIARNLFAENEQVSGSNGNDHLYGFAGNDLVSGGNGNDFLYGNKGSDYLQGGQGVDHLFGGTGNDWLTGGSETDILDGGAGRDTALYVRFNKSVVATLNDGKTSKAYIGLTDVDILKSIENLYGGSANDRLTGNSHGNRLDGYAGKDVLNGKGGNDIISGGWDNDRLTGGPGSDRFYFDSLIYSKFVNIDTITDFRHGVDKLFLDKEVFLNLLPYGKLSPENFLAGKGATYGRDHDYIIYDSKAGNLYFDAKGNGSDVVIQFAHLNGAPHLTADDFRIGDLQLFI